jgi:surface polysaccharide O-acyltransferase-like enzyme
MDNAAQLAAATPVTRDRYVDLLRVVSLGVVVLGHWFMAVVVVGGDGAVRSTNVMAILPSLQPVTWLLQVMPVFFLVGGFSHATAGASLRRRGGRYADFVRSRAGRLLRPTSVFIVVWMVLAVAIELAGADRGVLRLATRVVAQPLWFVGVYLGVVALAPAMLRLHERCGRFAAVVPVGLGAAAGVVDVARFACDVPFVGFLNLALVWLGVHQVGFLYADGRLGSRRLPLALMVAGLAGTVVLTTAGPYPTSMVGMPGEPVSNMSPPTFALAVCSVWLIGLVLLVRAPVSRWLARPGVWRGVVTANGLAMTAFLWHLTAMFAATALALTVGIPQPAVGSGTWWLLRPVWIAVLALVTAVLVLVFRRADRPRPARVAGGRTSFAVTGMVLCTLGVLGFSAVGFGGVIAGRTATLIVLPVTPLVSAALLVVGAVCLRDPGRPVSRTGARSSKITDDQAAAVMLTIQAMPKRSSHWPNSSPQTCFSRAMVTVPPSDSLPQ